MTVDPRLAHLVGRCGSCTYWDGVDYGNGNCALKNEPGAPIQFYEGSVQTRIDFSCAWWQPAEGFDEFGSDRTEALTGQLRDLLDERLVSGLEGDLYANGEKWLLDSPLGTCGPETLVIFPAGELRQFLARRSRLDRGAYDEDLAHLDRIRYRPEL